HVQTSLYQRIDLKIVCNMRDRLYCYIFFFSSRRRHTRLVSDWSSDVCSSDLKNRNVSVRISDRSETLRFFWPQRHVERGRLHPRSEERRVGKECRSRWSRDH